MMPDRDPVPALAREVIDLYRGPLAGVRFPELDRDVLDAAELELLEAQRALEDAERALDTARAQVAEQVSALGGKVQRALAYARVFAEEQPELRERVDAIAASTSRIAPSKRAELAREPSGATAPRRSRRGRKGGDDGATLFEAPAPASHDDGGQPAAITDAA